VQPKLAHHATLLEPLVEGALLVDSAGLVVYGNPAAAAIFGVPASALLIPLREYPARYRLRERDGQALPLPLGTEALAGRSAGPRERTMQRPDGSQPVLRISASPLRDSAGAVEGALVLLVDITRERELERVDSERQFHAFFDAMPQLGWTATPAGFLDHYNDGWYAFTGKTYEEMRGWGWQSVHDPALLPQVIERWKRALATGTPFEMEFTLRRHDGARRWFLTRAVPLRDAAGEIIRWVGINTDIHEQKTVEEEKARLLEAAEAANRAKDEFLAMLGHELRNPLAPIVTAVQLMKLRSPAPSRERDVIERQAKHLVRLVDDLLDVSRVVRGKIDLHPRPLLLADLLAKAIEVASPAIEKAEHQLALDLAPGLWVSADEIRLTQVFSNLLTNAAKYTPPRGHLSVQAHREGDEVLVTVRDDGIGIEADLLPRVFDLFVQGARGIDRSEGGLGLGLALVRTLTELHGGQVSAFSDGRGQGSEFTVSLPSIPAPPAQAPAQTTSAAPGKRRRVLVVDDNADAAALLAALLREAGHEVAAAHDALSAESLLQEFAPEVAVLDLGLPVVDGIELGRRLRARDPRVVLIAVTGYGQEADRKRSEAAGFVRHLIKPVAAEALLESVEA
jgi:PAS domain S-box-containing protein